MKPHATQFMTELQRNHRKELMYVLRLLTSREEQLKYQHAVPFAPVTNELFCQWAACYDQKRSMPWFLQMHPAVELSALDRFQNVVATVRAEFADRLPPIEEFITLPQWERLASGAATALAVIESSHESAAS